MKLNKEEFTKKINEYDISDDLKIELLENVTDSIDTDSTLIDDLKNQIDVISKERDDIKTKYIERFNNDSINIPSSAIKESIADDIKEKNYIDIRSI